MKFLLTLHRIIILDSLNLIHIILFTIFEW
jgi:hypothetical protein